MGPVSEKDLIQFKTSEFSYGDSLDDTQNEAFLFHCPSQQFDPIDGIRASGFDPTFSSVGEYDGKTQAGMYPNPSPFTILAHQLCRLLVAVTSLTGD